MHFSKVHGVGNDFILVNGFRSTIDNSNKLAIKLCDRRFGVGADGLVIVLPSNSADFRMRIFNADGSEGEMCGNATRCVARYVYEHGLTNKAEITLETIAGLITSKLLFDNGVISSVRVDIGIPRFKRGEIPMTGNPDEQAINVAIQIMEDTYQATCVLMGVPHCVIFVDDISAIDIAVVGPMIETHPLFPRKTNVEFVQVQSEGELRMRVWERGIGITMACGTGASATLVAAVLKGKASRQATIHLDGGDLTIEWGVDNHVYMSGPAVEVFHGERKGG
ncbi:MAG: Diaminopimelate epimerase [Firmicutes bacterium]|nr:Diaminopimelate epimerase [Bacillota bacterium]